MAALDCIAENSMIVAYQLLNKEILYRSICIKLDLEVKGLGKT